MARGSKKLSAVEQQVSALAALRKISIAVNAAVSDLEEIVPLILSKACELVSATHGSLVLINEDEKTLQIVSVVGDDWTPEARGCSLKLGVGITGRVAQTGETYLCKDTTIDPHYFSLFPKVRSELAVPVRCQGEVVGLINLDSEEVDAFTPFEVELLSMMADQAGIALQNARQLAKALAARQEWEDIFQAAEDGRLVCTPSFAIERYNCSFQMLFGLHTEQLRNQSIDVLTTEFPALAPGHAVLTQLEMQGRIEVKLQSESGARTFRLSGTRASLNGKPVYLLSFNETTKYDELQAQIAQSEKMVALGQMVAGVAHELNNPLQTVCGYAELLLESASSPKQTDWLRAIHREGERAAKLVRTLLTYGRNIPPEFERQAVGPLMEQIFRGWQQLYQDQSIEVKLVVIGSAEGWVILDKFQMEQVFHNLLSNAQHALLAAGTLHPLIRLIAEVQADTVVFKVVDNGPGIDPSNLDKLFRPFFTTKRNGEGTGLGLAICRNLVERNGGKIRCDSTLGSGTTFQIEAPRVPELAADAAPVTQGFALRKPRILLVDDEEAIRELLKEVLTSDGCDVDVARNASMAMGFLTAARTYDLVLCDINMPQINGVDFYLQVAHERPDWARNFVFVSANPLPADSSPPGANKMPELIQKPFDIAYLKRFVRDWLISHRS